MINDCFKVRRNYLSHYSNLQNSVEKSLKVTFIGESAVDDGGPRREFFSGKQTFMVFNASFICILLYLVYSTNDAKTVVFVHIRKKGK